MRRTQGGRQAPLPGGGWFGSGDVVHASLTITLLLGVWCAHGLEVSVGKVTSIDAKNGSTVLLPCTYASCIGIKNLFFSWHFAKNTSWQIKMCEGHIAYEGADPRLAKDSCGSYQDPEYEYAGRVEFVGDSKTNNISILLFNITFDDEGEYVCFARNPKEKNKNHSTTYTLRVVDKVKVVDNTLTTIIVSVVGGVIGLIIVVMVIKALVLNFLIKDPEKTKECLVSSSGPDNTDNGLSGVKTDDKAKPKA